MGKVAAYTPQVYLLNEPTRGVDIRAKESTLSTIHCEFRKQSCVIITSPGVEDPIKICNRTLILYEGKVIDWFSREEFSEKQIHRTMRGEVIHIDEVKKS